MLGDRLGLGGQLWTKAEGGKVEENAEVQED